jgi:hypothetical protein
MTMLERFCSKIEITPNCWIWKAQKNLNGYGRFRVCTSISQFFAHRLSYIIHRGEIADGLQIDHLCRNRACVNPWHMEVVTGRTNTLRSFNIAAINARKTHCKNGHPFDQENTYRERKTGNRRCRICAAESDKAAWIKRKVRRVTPVKE